MSKKIGDLEELVEFLSIAIAKERDSVELYSRAYRKSVSAAAPEIVQKKLWLIAKQEKEHETKLREQLHAITLEIMRIRGSRRIETSIVINASPEKVFALLTNVERLPEYNDLIKEAKITSKKRTGVESTRHYVGVAGGESGEWDSVVTEWVENERIAWRTTSGDFAAFGSDTLKPVRGGTKHTTVMNYELPYSILGRIIDKLKVSKDIEKGMIKGLQNLKNFLEKK
jgi:uncharacterized membrane protein